MRPFCAVSRPKPPALPGTEQSRRALDREYDTLQPHLPESMNARRGGCDRRIRPRRRASPRPALYIRRSQKIVTGHAVCSAAFKSKHIIFKLLLSVIISGLGGRRRIALFRGGCGSCMLKGLRRAPRRARWQQYCTNRDFCFVAHSRAYGRVRARSVDRDPI